MNIIYGRILRVYTCNSWISLFFEKSLNHAYGECSCHILQATSNWCKKDEPVYITEEKGVIGLNFHQSKEAQFHDQQVNGYYDVSFHTCYCSIILLSLVMIRCPCD